MDGQGPPGPGPREAGRLIPLLLLGPFLAAGAVTAVEVVLSRDAVVQVGRHIEYLRGWSPAAPDLTLLHLSGLGLQAIDARARKTIELVNAAHADLIVITGGFLGPGGRLEDLRVFLSALEARRGKFAVLSEGDRIGGLDGLEGETLMRAAGFVLLRNAWRRLATPSGPIVIAGIDDPAGGRDNMRRALSGIPRREVSLLLSHDAGIARDLGNWDVDFVFAARSPGDAAPAGWSDVAGGARLHVNQGAALLTPARADLITLRGGPPKQERARRYPGRA